MDHLSIRLREAMNSAQGKTSLVSFIESAPLVGFFWANMKRLYKLVEQTNDNELLVALMLRFDKMKFERSDNNKMPSSKTMGYMKRRAIRHLKNIAQKEPQRYRELCILFLQKQEETIDFSFQWIVHYILKGNSKRYEHSRHGRGKIIQKMDIPAVNRSEERFATLWDEQPQMVNELFEDQYLTTTVLDFAVKVLHRNGLSIPTFSEQQALVALQSDSPWLQVFAYRQAFAKLQNGAVLSNEMAAYLIYIAKGQEQEKLISLYGLDNTLQETTEKPNESIFDKMRNFLGGTRSLSDESPKSSNKKLLSQLLSICVNRPDTSRTETAIRLVYQWKDEVPVADVHEIVKPMLKQDHPVLNRLALHLCRKVHTEDWKWWLSALSGADEDLKLAVFDSIGKANNRKDINRDQLYKLVESDDFISADFAWYIMLNEKKMLSNDVLNNLYWRIPSCGWNYLPARHLLQSEYGIKLMSNKYPYWMNKMNYRFEFSAKVAMYGHTSIRSRVKENIISSLKHYFWHGLSSLKYFDDRDEIVEQLKPKVNLNSYYYHAIVDCLLNRNEWVKTLAIEVLTKHNFPKGRCSHFVAYLIGQLNEDRFERLQFLFEDQKWRSLLEEQLQEYLTNGKDFERTLVINRLDQLQAYLSTDILVQLMEQLNNSEWEQWRTAIQNGLESADTEKLWADILVRLQQDNQDVLLGRLMENDRFKAQILALDNPLVLDVKQIALQEIVVEWTERHQALLQKDQSLLFKALVHKLQGVRSIASEICKSLEPSMPFIVQLLESDLPDTEALGRKLIDNSSDRAYLEGILSMVDSPNKKVRGWALELIEQQPTKLNIPYVLECLTEHSDSQIQAFVLSQKESTATETKGKAYLQKNVMNGRNRARKAKELIKQKTDSNVPVEILLEMARGNNKNDAEWALLELAKVSLAGSEIAGFELA